MTDERTHERTFVLLESLSFIVPYLEQIQRMQQKRGDDPARHPRYHVPHLDVTHEVHEARGSTAVTHPLGLSVSWSSGSTRHVSPVLYHRYLLSNMLTSMLSQKYMFIIGCLCFLFDLKD